MNVVGKVLHPTPLFECAYAVKGQIGRERWPSQRPLLIVSDRKGIFIMESIVETIGNTPLLKLESLQGRATVYAKLERFNPGGSIKDRVVQAMLTAAEESGELKAGMTVLEPVAGNTGIALALLCRLRAYRLILTMPEDYMPERRYVLECCGAEIELTPAAAGISGAIRRAAELKQEHPDYFIPDHFHNEVQVEAHSQGLVQEIRSDLADIIPDALVGCVGTGSSLQALARYYRPHGTKIFVVTVSPRARTVPGIDFGLSESLLDKDWVDQTVQLTMEEALQGFQELAASTGVLAGLSSGATYRVAKKLSLQLGTGKNILTIFYDGGERYFSLEKTLRKEVA